VTSLLAPPTTAAPAADTSVQSPEPAGNHYMVPLDGIRALAVMGVIAAHAGVPYLQSGVIGVDVFFVLSGFLITTLAIREFDTTGRFAVRAFWRRRFFRLFPLLAVVTAATVVVFATFRPDDWWHTVTAAPYAITYTGAFARAAGVDDLGYFGHTWSLSVEEVFYLLFPGFLCVSIRFGGRTAIVRSIHILTICAVIYRIPWVLHQHIGDRLYYGPDMRAEQILIGCSLAALLPRLRYATRFRSWTGWLTPFAILVFVVPFAPMWTKSLYFAGGSTSIALASAAIIANVITRPGFLARVLSSRLLVYIGRRSYGIYLWHYATMALVFTFTSSTLHLRWSAGMALRLGVTLLLAELSYRLVERPFRRLGAGLVLSSR
jgi:peptidoglycan/LPS O-acetylase OafA/YrhL